MAQWETTLALHPGGQGLIPEDLTEVEGENQLHRAVLTAHINSLVLVFFFFKVILK